MSPDVDDDPPEDGDPPRRPRARPRLRLSAREITTILMLVVCLVAVLTLRQGCANGVVNLFRAFEPPAGSASPTTAPQP